MALTSQAFAMTPAVAKFASANVADGSASHRFSDMSEAPLLPAATMGKRLNALGAPQQTFRMLVAVVAPLCAAITFRSRRRQQQVSNWRALSKVVRYVGAADTPCPTLTPRVWDLLGIKTSSSRDEIRRAYKQYIVKHHPDVKGSDDPEFAEKFEKLTAAYKEVMDMSDDEFWLESFDAGVTQVVTGKINSPSLNPWETKYRNWAREQGIFGGADSIQLEGADMTKDTGPASLFLSASGVEAAQDDALQPSQPVSDSKYAKDINSATGTNPTIGQEVKTRTPQDDSLRPDQIVLGGAIGFGAVLLSLFLFIVVSASR